MKNIYYIVTLLVLLYVLLSGTIFYLLSLPSENRNPLYKICTILITLLIVIIFSGQLITYIGRNVDDINYTFEYHDEIIGEWVLVDYVEKPEYFNLDNQSHDVSTLGFDIEYTNAQNQTYSNLSIRYIEYSNNNKLTNPVVGFPQKNQGFYEARQWTKGYIIDTVSKTSSKYILKSIGNNEYVFIENKNENYIYFRKEPWYYVLIKTKDSP